MVARPTSKVQCRRFMSALLPATELLLRGIMDLRLKHWQMAPRVPDITMRVVVQRVRSTAPGKGLTQGHVFAGWRQSMYLITCGNSLSLALPDAPCHLHAFLGNQQCAAGKEFRNRR